MDSLSSMFQGTYNPGFQVGKNFKTIGQDAWGMNNWITPDYIKQMSAAQPDLFKGIDNPAGMITPNMIEGESQQTQQGWNIDPKLMEILGQYQLQRRGAGGMEDGRTNAMVGPDGKIAYAGQPYKYDPAGDTVKALTEGGLLATAMFGGLGLAGAGPWSSLQGMIDGGAGGLGANAAGHGAFLGETGSLVGAEAGALGGAGAAGAGGIGTLAAEATPAFTTYAGGALPTGAVMPLAASSAGGLGSMMKTAMPALTKVLGGAGGSGADNILSRLAGMYFGNRQQNSAMDLYKSLDNQFAPGSPYEQTMRQELDRRDAASGRRSQYGPREVELQAKLAEMRSKNAMTLSALMDKSNSGLEQMIQSGLYLGKDLGLNDIFGKMIGDVGNKVGDWWDDLFGDD